MRIAFEIGPRNCRSLAKIAQDALTRTMFKKLALDLDLKADRIDAGQRNDEIEKGGREGTQAAFPYLGASKGDATAMRRNNQPVRG